MSSLLPAFDDAALSASRERAHGVWQAESGKERDRLLALETADLLAALDDETVRQNLTPEHRAELRASIRAGRIAQPAQPVFCHDYEAELLAWRRRDAAALAHAASLRRRQFLDRCLLSGAAAAFLIMLVCALIGI